MDQLVVARHSDTVFGHRFVRMKIVIIWIRRSFETDDTGGTGNGDSR